MRIGLDIVDFFAGVRPLGTGRALADIRDAEHDGLSTAWVPVIAGGPDPMTVCALAAGAGRRIGLATGVVRTWAQHPVELARSALTIGDAAAGGLVLGVGVSHRHLVEPTYGLAYSHPVAHLTEYLGVLRCLLDTGRVSFSGLTLSAHAELDRTNDSNRVLLGAAAGGPRMLGVAGAAADVVITNMAGPRTLAERTVPIVRRSAHEAGRAAPRVAAAFSVCVTDDPGAAKANIDEVLTSYARIPEYRAMLDAEGVSSPSELALVGTEDVLARRIAALEEIGVTDLIASIKAVTHEDEDRTRRFLAALAGGLR